MHIATWNTNKGKISRKLRKIETRIEQVYEEL